jgi:hypothetical protein
MPGMGSSTPYRPSATSAMSTATGDPGRASRARWVTQECESVQAVGKPANKWRNSTHSLEGIESVQERWVESRREATARQPRDLHLGKWMNAILVFALFEYGDAQTSGLHRGQRALLARTLHALSNNSCEA